MTYRIHHVGGSSDIFVNQQQPSGTWFHLRAFAMATGQNHRVEVEGALEGETVADAIRFVSAGTSAPGISYVHADHLGSPQKMTDSTKAIVWDTVYTPFGQVHSITGTATNPQRFPGQYADAESGYSYNYFRDYDPTTGRYIQSDPIGLDGGFNTYTYVGGNPVIRTDPWGLIPPDSIPNFGTKCIVIDSECFLSCTDLFDFECSEVDEYLCKVARDPRACARCGSSLFDIGITVFCGYKCSEVKEGCECEQAE